MRWTLNSVKLPQPYNQITSHRNSIRNINHDGFAAWTLSAERWRWRERESERSAFCAKSHDPIEHSSSFTSHIWRAVTMFVIKSHSLCPRGVQWHRNSERISQVWPTTKGDARRKRSNWQCCMETSMHRETDQWIIIYWWNTDDVSMRCTETAPRYWCLTCLLMCFAIVRRMGNAGGAVHPW